MIEEIKNFLRTNLEKAYLYLCLWGNERKLRDEKHRRILKDENDILKEEFERRIALL